MAGLADGKAQQAVDHTHVWASSKRGVIVQGAMGRSSGPKSSLRNGPSDAGT